MKTNQNTRVGIDFYDLQNWADDEEVTLAEFEEWVEKAEQIAMGKLGTALVNGGSESLTFYIPLWRVIDYINAMRDEFGDLTFGIWIDESVYGTGSGSKRYDVDTLDNPEDVAEEILRDINQED